jgi:hypothetical protein
MIAMIGMFVMFGVFVMISMLRRRRRSRAVNHSDDRLGHKKLGTASQNANRPFCFD